MADTIITAPPITLSATVQTPVAPQQDLPANPSGNKSALWALALCLLLVSVCYANSLGNAFILDDVLIVAANEQIRSIQPLHFLLQPYWGGQLNGGIYRPLTIFSYSLEYSIWQGWPAGFRLVNLLLHVLNGWLVFLLARSLLRSELAGFAAAGLYVVHPVNTEAVVSIVGRSELLAATGFFAGWLAFRKGRTWWAAAAYFMSLLAKESAITLPAIIALEMLFAEGGVRRVRDSWNRFAVLGAAAIAYLGLRFYVLGGLGIPRVNQYLHGSLTFWDRWITSGRVFLRYFQLLLWPVQITGDYDFNSVPVATLRGWDGLLGLTIVAACIFAAVRTARNRPMFSLGILFFFVALLPVSNWILPISLLMAERFLYLPLFGFALLGGGFWAGIDDRRIRRWTAAGVLSVAAILCIGHNYIWQDKLTFHRNLVRVSPENARGRLGYGFALLNVGKTEDAKVQFEEGLRILPNSAPLLAGLAATIMRIDHNCDRVRPMLGLALVEDASQWQSLWVLGDCFVEEGQTSLAEAAYRRAVRITDFPDPLLLYSWGRSLEDLGDRSTAITAYERAAKIDPMDEVIKMRLKLLRN